MKIDIYKTVTDRVIEQMESAGSNWMNPFNKGKTQLLPFNCVSQKNYNGVNVLLLNFTKFQSNAWASFKQWNERGCSVRKGQRGQMIVYFQFLEREDENKEKVNIPFIRYSTVFNSEQVEGDYARLMEARSEEGDTNDVEDLTHVESWVAQTGAVIKHSLDARAYYMPGLDMIHMPEKSRFRATPHSSATECYYSTLVHELTHWTGHESRLDRGLMQSRFGGEAYAFEELVAELGAAYLCANLRISTEPRVDHAQYLNEWLKVLRNDKHAIFTASSKARKACEFLLSENAVAKAA